MEITIDTLINLIGVLLGGGCGAIFTWRWSRRKAKAEAQTEEVKMAQAVQDTYQEMLEDKQKEVADNQRVIEELRKDRDHYRQVNNELRDRQDKTDDEVRALKNEVARNGRQIKQMYPFQCYDLRCKKRQRVPASECEQTDPAPTPATTLHDIEPNNED